MYIYGQFIRFFFQLCSVWCHTLLRQRWPRFGSPPFSLLVLVPMRKLPWGLSGSPRSPMDTGRTHSRSVVTRNSSALKTQIVLFFLPSQRTYKRSKCLLPTVIHYQCISLSLNKYIWIMQWSLSVSTCLIFCLPREVRPARVSLGFNVDIGSQWLFGK